MISFYPLFKRFFLKRKGLSDERIVLFTKKLWPIWIMLFYVFFCNIIKVNNCFIILLHLTLFFLHTRSLLVSDANVPILLSSLALNAILLTLPQKRYYGFPL